MALQKTVSFMRSLLAMFGWDGKWGNVESHLS